MKLYLKPYWWLKLIEFLGTPISVYAASKYVGVLIPEKEYIWFIVFGFLFGLWCVSSVRIKNEKSIS